MARHYNDGGMGCLGPILLFGFITYFFPGLFHALRPLFILVGVLMIINIFADMVGWPAAIILLIIGLFLLF